jgi:hypothetical protein
MSFREHFSLLKNSLGARFHPGSDTKHTDFGAFQARFVVAISSMPTFSTGSLLPGTWVNRTWVLLRVPPLHGLDHLLRLRRELVKLGSLTSEAHGHRLTLYVLEDYEAELKTFPEDHLVTSA